MNKKNFLLMGLAAVLFGCANPIHQVIVDAKVDELCAKDGKAVVYERETILLSGAKIALAKEYLKPGDTHYWQRSSESIKGSRSGPVPDVTRMNAKLFRVRDFMLIGEYTYYFREGGDFLPGHPSTYACKLSPGEVLLRDAFLAKEAK